MNLPSRFAKIADGLVMAVRPPMRVVGLSLKAPTRIKLPEKELPEAEPSALLELKPLFWPKNAGKLMNTASAVAFCGKRHGRERSNRRTKDLVATSGWKQDSLNTIDTIQRLDCDQLISRGFITATQLSQGIATFIIMDLISIKLHISALCNTNIFISLCGHIAFEPLR